MSESPIFDVSEFSSCIVIRLFSMFGIILLPKKYTRNYDARAKIKNASKFGSIRYNWPVWIFHEADSGLELFIGCSWLVPRSLSLSLSLSFPLLLSVSLFLSRAAVPNLFVSLATSGLSSKATQDHTQKSGRWTVRDAHCAVIKRKAPAGR